MTKPKTNRERAENLISEWTLECATKTSVDTWNFLTRAVEKAFDIVDAEQRGRESIVYSKPSTINHEPSEEEIEKAGPSSEEEIDEANKFYFRELESHEKAHVSYMAFRAGAYWRAHWKQKEQK